MVLKKYFGKEIYFCFCKIFHNALKKLVYFCFIFENHIFYFTKQNIYLKNYQEDEY